VSTANHQLEITASLDRVRADRTVQELLEVKLSRSRIQKLFEEGLVWRDEEVLRKSDKVYEGDLLQVSIPPNRPLEIRAVDLPLNVLYEDENFLALNKEPGMVTHPGAGTGEDTLVHALLHHCKGHLSGIGGVERPGIVHRLDKETSGVMVVAKSDRAYQDLARQFAERITQKHYLALIQGVPLRKSGAIDAPIGRHPVHRLKMCVRENGRSARSQWKIRETFHRHAALCEVGIMTGRTHQIRVHLSHLGHPVLGDTLYRYQPNSLPRVEIPRVMLHAWRLGLQHPVNGQPMTFEAPFPEDMEEVMGQVKATAISQPPR